MGLRVTQTAQYPLNQELYLKIRNYIGFQKGIYKELYKGAIRELRNYIP